MYINIFILCVCMYMYMRMCALCDNHFKDMHLRTYVSTHLSTSYLYTTTQQHSNTALLLLLLFVFANYLSILFALCNKFCLRKVFIT